LVLSVKRHNGNPLAFLRDLIVGNFDAACRVVLPDTSQAGNWRRAVKKRRALDIPGRFFVSCIIYFTVRTPRAAH
jgi:hypothetical protein